ncbi:MAG: hypothetical protein P1U81_01020 [Verrucomicrobiales bacterium]|nr:hypothetical protein [Verrucomicrobiales bacterium]
MDHLQKITALLLVSAVCSSPVFSQSIRDKILTASEARLLFEVERAEAGKPLVALQDNLDQALERLGKDLQNEGDLEGLLVIKQERETFRDRTEPAPPSPIEPLNALRQIYWRERESLQNDISAAERTAFETYRKSLEIIIRELTKAGEFDEALAVKNAIEVAEAEISGTEPASAAANVELVLGEEENYVIDTNCELTRRGGDYVITSEAFDGAYVAGKRVFKTPFRILARAETDSENIRLYFGQRGIVVLGWEVRPGELRIVEPVDRNQNGFPDAGFIKPNRMYDIEIHVTEEAITVTVDGEKRGEVRGNYSDAEGRIGIGPARGSVVTVEYFKGIQEQIPIP